MVELKQFVKRQLNSNLTKSSIHVYILIMFVCVYIHYIYVYVCHKLNISIVLTSINDFAARPTKIAITLALAKILTPTSQALGNVNRIHDPLTRTMIPYAILVVTVNKFCSLQACNF